jgi:cytochrome P450
MEHEDDNGKLEKIHIAKFLIKILIYTLDRLTQPVMVLFPELISKIFTSADRRWKRNIDRYEAFVEEIGKKREASGVEGTDLLSILNSFSEYKGDYRKIAHELGVFLFAGMRTIQFTTINTVYYLTKHTAFFDKLMAEITPALEKSKSNFVENLDYDTVMGFEYLQQCYYEALRIDAPVEFSIPSVCNRDVTIGKGANRITIPAGVQFAIHMAEMHLDPSEWPEPERYEPERFNMKDTENKWLLTAKGEPRNPMGFNPFFGGKRICLGKTFAETVIRFTLPLLFHHFTFEIPPVQPPKPHMSANATKASLQMIIKTKNQVS